MYGAGSPSRRREPPQFNKERELEQIISESLAQVGLVPNGENAIWVKSKKWRCVFSENFVFFCCLSLPIKYIFYIHCSNLYIYMKLLSLDTLSLLFFTKHVFLKNDFCFLVAVLFSNPNQNIFIYITLSILHIYSTFFFQWNTLFFFLLFFNTQ